MLSQSSVRALRDFITQIACLAWAFTFPSGNSRNQSCQPDLHFTSLSSFINLHRRLQRNREVHLIAIISGRWLRKGKNESPFPKYFIFPEHYEEKSSTIQKKADLLSSLHKREANYTRKDTRFLSQTLIASNSKSRRD